MEARIVINDGFKHYNISAGDIFSIKKVMLDEPFRTGSWYSVEVALGNSIEKFTFQRQAEAQDFHDLLVDFINKDAWHFENLKESK